jgi:hypothetical protein
MRPSINVNQTERIVRALERAGYQATPNRRLVARLVAATGGHFTAADLLERGRRERVNIGRATVFRALEVLTSLQSSSGSTCRAARTHTWSAIPTSTTTISSARTAGGVRT